LSGAHVNVAAVPVRRFALACSFALAAVAPACGGGTPVTPPDVVTVRGQVMQGSVPSAGAVLFATNNSGVAVALGDASLFPAPAPIVADGTGHFVVGGFGSSYDLVIFPTSDPRNATIVQNLTRRDPTIALPLPENTPVHACHVTTTWPVQPPAGSSIAYFLQGQTYAGVKLLSVTPVDDNLADGLTATWRGSFSTTANVVALVFMKDPKSGLPTSYVGYATTYAWLIDQRESPFVVSLQTITTSQMTLNLQAPAGYSVETADVAMDLVSPDLTAEGTPVDLAHFDAPNGTLTVSVPDLPFNRLLARGTATNGASVSMASVIDSASTTKTPNLALTFSASSDLGGPADGATAVDSTTAFSWSGAGVNEILFSSSDAGAPSFRVVTTTQSLTLGQFQGLSNAAIPAGSHYTWSARRWPDFSTVDAFEDPNVDLPNANSALSAPRSFTFATTSLP
jgi:hypothetical protein